MIEQRKLPLIELLNAAGSRHEPLFFIIVVTEFIPYM
jgi:hypothetical protein